MSADLLREAAALMRKRAEATLDTPWKVYWPGDGTARVSSVPNTEVGWDGTVAICDSDAEATHIASWHPDVALAVADWLDAEAHAGEQLRDALTAIRGRADLNWEYGSLGKAAAVARAYLGRQP